MAPTGARHTLSSMRRQHLTETWLVLGVSLGASAIWSLLRIVDKLTRSAPLGSQTTSMNSSVTPDRPWLDLAYQLTGVALAVVPVLLALHLLRRDDPDEPHTMGFDLRRPGQDLVRGAVLAAVIGLPGLALYAAAKALDLNTTIAAANPADGAARVLAERARVLADAPPPPDWDGVYEQRSK